ncbi:O-antigen ligase family protein [Thauera mechernichensis]|nr:O-antigen ligase family protein [Thauera mechernichensis]MDG3063493.1 O-antigen ligase family protein [Thauera mechernichensis]
MQTVQRVSIELVFVALFLGLSPIYWLPLLPFSLLLTIKVMLLGVVVFYPFLRFKDGVYALPKFITPLLGFSVALAIPSAIAHLSFDFIGLFAILFLVAIGYTLSCCYGTERALNSLFMAVVVFSLIAMLVVIDFAAGGIFINPMHSVRLYLYQTGLHGGRTGWTAICNVFLAISLFGLIVSKPGLTRGALITSSVVLLLNLVVVDSRGGLITGVFVLSIYLLHLAANSRVKAFFLLMVFWLGGVLIAAEFGERLISSRTYLSIFAPEELRSGVTTGRTDGFWVAIRLYVESPLIGVGEINLKDYGQDVEKVHNVWLRTLAEQGFLGFLSLLVFSLGLFAAVFKRTALPRSAIYMVLAAGLVPSLFEPTGVFGNYFATAPFWITVGLLLAPADYDSLQRSASLMGSNRYERC